MKNAILVAMAMVLIAVVEGLWSYYVRKDFTATQMFARYGRPGIPLGWHGGYWGDLIALPIVFALVVGMYGDWTTPEIEKAVAIGVAITLANHLLLVFTQNKPDPFGWKNEWISTLIVLHAVYMTIGVAVAILFYFYTPGVTTAAAVIISVLLGIHMTFGIHIPLGLANLRDHWRWCPDFLEPQALVMLAVIWLTLSAFAARAAGPVAGSIMVVVSLGVIARVLYEIRTFQAV